MVLDVVTRATKEDWLNELLSVSAKTIEAKPASRWKIDQVRKVLSSVAEEKKDIAEASDAPYRRAAAVLIEFDPQTLIPFRGGDGKQDREQVMPYLLADCDRRGTARVHSESCDAPDKVRSRWALRDKVRVGILKQLLTNGEIAAALEANPKRLRDVARRYFETVLLGNAPPIDRVPEDELRAYLRVIELLGGVVTNLPSISTLRGRLEFGNLLRPFEILADRQFIGRSNELMVLRNYVGTLRNRSLISKLRTSASAILGLHEKPPLLIQGIGGMGKSTLLAKFIMEHAREPDQTRQTSFVYLDLDRPGLFAEEPASLLIEAARQLACQYPNVAEIADQFTQKWVRLVSSVSHHSADTDADVPLYSSSSSFSSEAESDAPSVATVSQELCIGEFAGLVQFADATDRPLLFVLDTFEEVQLRSSDFVDALFEFLDALQRQLPRLRTVLAGRNDVPNFRTQLLVLGNLSSGDSSKYLQLRGITPETAARMAKALPGNPLLLRVTADLFLKLDPKAQLAWDFENLSDMDSEMAQAVFYKRFLDHVQDPQVKQLANPGLVLRQVTPEIIQMVLAKPCGIKELSDENARRLFEQMKIQLPMINEESDVLRLRSDLRRLVVRAFERQSPSQVGLIHEMAIDYYSRRDSTVDRAEELYHRLKLDQPRASSRQPVARRCGSTTCECGRRITSTGTKLSGF